MTGSVLHRALRARAPRFVLFILALIGAAILACLGAYRALAPRRTEVLALPHLELRDLDRAVAKAIEEASAAVRASPKSADRWGKLGMILTAHEMAPEAADRCYRQAALFNPHDVRWPYHRGMALATGSSQVAILELRRAAAIGGEAHPIVRLQLAELLLQQGRLAEAEEELRPILNRLPNDPRAHLTQARIAFQRDDREAGLEHLEYAVGDPQTRKAGHILRAQIYMSKGDQRAAAPELAAASRAPADAPWPNALDAELIELRAGKRRRLAEADEWLARNRPDEAIASLRATLAESPDLGWAWLLQGRALLMRHDLSGAEETLRTATRLVPDSAEAQYYLGVLLYLQKNRSAAAACFRRATELEPTLADAHLNLADCLAEQGDRAGAIEALRTASRCKPDSARAHARLGDLLSADGKDAEAIEHLRTAVELDPADAKAKEQLEKLRAASPP